MTLLRFTHQLSFAFLMLSIMSFFEGSLSIVIFLFSSKHGLTSFKIRSARSSSFSSFNRAEGAKELQVRRDSLSLRRHEHSMYKHILHSLSEVSSLLSSQRPQPLRKGGAHVLHEVQFGSFSHLLFSNFGQNTNHISRGSGNKTFGCNLFCVCALSECMSVC